MLDVGVGSGFLAAAFAHLVGSSGRVVGIDRKPALVQLAEANLRRQDPALLSSGRVRLLLADGWRKINEGPFDAIHVGAAAATLPDELVAMLKPGGRMVIPVGPEGSVQELVQVDRGLDGRVQTQALMSVRYVPLIRGTEGSQLDRR